MFASVQCRKIHKTRLQYFTSRCAYNYCLFCYGLLLFYSLTLNRLLALTRVHLLPVIRICVHWQTTMCVCCKFWHVYILIFFSNSGNGRIQRKKIFLIWKNFVHLLEMILVFSESALTCSESSFAQLTQTSMKPRNTVVSTKWHILRNVLLICSAYHGNTLYVLEWMELLFSYLKQQHVTGYKKNVSFMLLLISSNNISFYLVSTFEQFLNKSRFLSNFPLPHANNLFISPSSRHLHPDTN